MTDDEPENWLDNQNVVIAGGLAALLLLALLIYGVVRVADDSSQPPDVVFPGTSPATSPTHTSGLVTPPSTSYSMPSVQTNQPGVPPPGPQDPPPADSGGGPATVDTPTTIYNPYATPSSSSSAGHV